MAAGESLEQLARSRLAEAELLEAKAKGWQIDDFVDRSRSVQTAAGRHALGVPVIALVCFIQDVNLASVCRIRDAYLAQLDHVVDWLTSVPRWLNDDQVRDLSRHLDTAFPRKAPHREATSSRR